VAFNLVADPRPCTFLSASGLFFPWRRAAGFFNDTGMIRLRMIWRFRYAVAEASARRPIEYPSPMNDAAKSVAASDVSATGASTERI
jgi:hypothetical protein